MLEESTTSKTTLRTSLVLIWYDNSPYSNQGLGKTIGSTTDHKDQSMKKSSFYNKHTNTWLGMVPKEAKTIFLELTATTCTKCTWIRGSHYFHPNIYFMNRAWRKCLHNFPTLAGCSTRIMEETKCYWWAQRQLIGISISLDFHHYVNNVIVLVTPKDVMVYARGINHE